MKRATLLILLLVAASSAFAASWYSIDGFTVEVDDSIGIEADSAEAEIVGFRLDGESEPRVAGWLASANFGPMSVDDMLVIGAIGIVRSLATAEDDDMESIEISDYRSPRGIEGSWLSVYSTAGYHDAYVIPLETPGGQVAAMILVPRIPGSEGRSDLDRVLESLEVVVEEAAG